MNVRCSGTMVFNKMLLNCCDYAMQYNCFQLAIMPLLTIILQPNYNAEFEQKYCSVSGGLILDIYPPVVQICDMDPF